MTVSEVKSAVRAALDGLCAQYGEEHVRELPDGQGGAWVEIDGLELGDAYQQESTSLICLLPFNLPNADVYPTFVRHDLARADGAALGEGFQVTQVQLPGDAQPRAVVQVSRRTREGLYVEQTPAQKIEKVLAWVRSR